MRSARTVTLLLFAVLMGMAIGSLISGNGTLLIWTIVLLVIDMIAGIALQCVIDRDSKKDDWNSLSFEEKIAQARALREKAMQAMRDEGIDIDGEIEKLCDEMNRQYGLGKYSSVNRNNKSNNGVENIMYQKFMEVYSGLRVNEKLREIKSLLNDEAGRLLFNLCQRMPHAPLPHSLLTVHAVFRKDIGYPAIFYCCRYDPKTIAENVLIILVGVGNSEIRMFTLETHNFSYFLCEYSGNRHLNYGEVELERTPAKIIEILKN